MKTYSYTFSPTGTSAMIAQAVGQGIRETTGEEVLHQDLTHQEAPESRFDDSNLVIIAAPVYGGKMAPIAKIRMKEIRGNHTPCILIAVYGNRAFENALVDMAEFAMSRGFVPVAAGAFIGEHSYSTPETPIAVGRPDKTDIKDAVAFGNAIGNAARVNGLKPVEVSELHDQPVPQKSVANFSTFVKEYMASQQSNPTTLLPELNSSLCTSCASCLKACPTDAIGQDIASIDSSRCIRCCACVKVCPTGARTFSSPFAPVLSRNFSLRKSPAVIIGRD